MKRTFLVRLNSFFIAFFYLTSINSGNSDSAIKTLRLSSSILDAINFNDLDNLASLNLDRDVLNKNISDNRKPIEIAAQRGYLILVRYLLRQGANPEPLFKRIDAGEDFPLCIKSWVKKIRSTRCILL